jgi:hypothetical protein
MKTGIYHDISFDDYRAIDAVNCSFLKTVLNRSPLHAQQEKDNPKEPTAALRQGSILHGFTFERGEFENVYAIAPEVNKRTNAGKEELAKFAEDNLGKQIISQAEFDMAKIQYDNLLNHEGAKVYLQEGKPEVTIIWLDKLSGLLCKARIDYLHEWQAVIADLKTTQDASIMGFSKSILNFGYEIQAAFYVDGYTALTGDEPSFVLIPIEKQPPYAAACYEVGHRSITKGRSMYQEAMAIVKRCKESGIWESYSQKVEHIEIPSWALPAVERLG